MDNEAAHCLAEGVVNTPEEADLGLVLGLGWPVARGGGPLGYARRVGVEQVFAQLERWANKYGPRFTPNPILLEL